MKQTVDLLLFPRWLAPMAPSRILLENHCVAVKDGQIEAILDANEARSKYEAKHEWLGNDHLLFPGLINTHTHTPMNLFKGIADDLPFQKWLHNTIWPREAKFVDPTFVVDGSSLAAAEMLLSGTTTFNDMYIYPEFTAEAVRHSGMRAVLSLPIFDFETQWSKSPEESFKKGETFLADYQSNDHLFLAVAPHAPYSVNDDNFLKAKRFADKHGLLVHCHLHETYQEVTNSCTTYNMAPIERLDKLGVLDERFLAVHMIAVSDQEQDIIASRGVSIAHCPESNMKLASGIAPVSAYIEKGINVTVGTDGAASNNDLNLLGEIQTASFLAKGISHDAEALDAWQALEMVTTNAAKALGLDNQIGSLQKGHKADMVAVDLKHIATQPIYNPVAQLIYAASRDQVSDVWVDGNHLVKDTKLTQIDLDELFVKAEKWMKILAENVS